MSKMDEKINLANSPQLGRIEKMVQEMCPDGVKWVKLGEVGNNIDKRRKPITSANRIEGEYPYYGASGIVDYVEGYIFDEDILLISEDGANLLSRTYPIAFRVSGKCWVNNHAHVMTFDNDATRVYVEHYLNSIDLSPWVSAGAQPKLTKENLNNIDIPLPPLPIQEAIADILDKFDRLSAELQAELQARKQQYEYYRDQLLAPSNSPRRGESEWKEYTLGELGPVLRGKRLTKSQLLEGGMFKVFHGGLDPIGFFDKSNRSANTVMIINVGASAGTVGFSKEEFWSSDGCFCLSQSKLVESKYLFYLLKEKESLLRSRVRHAGIPTLDGKNIESINVSLPPLSEQARIVAILDKFEALVNDLSQGLPAEIAAVKEQYEYYRNKLLTF